LILNLGTTINSIDPPKKSSLDSEQILNLQEEIKFLENQIKDHHSSIDLLENNLQLTTNENEQLKHNYLEIQEKYDLLIKDNHNLTNQLNNIRHSSIEEVCLISNSILPIHIFLFLSVIKYR